MIQQFFLALIILMCAGSVSAATFGYERVINVRDFGAACEGTGDDATAIQSAIDDSPRGIVQIPNTEGSECRITSGLVLPKGTNSVVLQGHGMSQCRILAVGLESTVPVIKWDDSVTGDVTQASGIRGCRIDRDNSGPVIQFRQNSGNTGASGDRFLGFLENLVIRSTDATNTDTLLEIEFGLNAIARNVRFENGGTCFHVDNGSNWLIEKIISPQKSSECNLLHIQEGGEHVIIHPRSETARVGGFSYKLENVGNTVLVGPRTEGHKEDAIYDISGSNNITILNPGVGVADESTAVTPRGVKIVNSHQIRIISGQGKPYQATHTNEAFEIDSNSDNIIIDGFRFTGGTPANEFADSGSNTRIVAYDANHVKFASGPAVTGNAANGTATVASGTTSITVSHGLDETPGAKDFTITGTNVPTNDPGHCAVINITATQFDISCKADPGSGGATFAWSVIAQ